MKMSWQNKPLGEVLDRTETTDPTRSPHAEFDYIDVSSVSNETLTIQETQRLKGKDAPSRARRLVRANDVLFATIRPTLRRIAIVPEEFDEQVCSTGYFVLRAKPEMHPRFLFYYLQTGGFMATMEKLQKGASYPAVTDGDIRSQPIPFPPLPEQQRIVAILDKAFAAIATAKANTAKNLENARALFESQLQSIFIDHSNGWEERPLESVSSILNGYAFKSTDFSSKGSVKCIKITNVGVRHFVPESDDHLPAPFASEYREVAVRSGDIVIALTRTIIAGGLKVAVVPPDHDQALLNQRVAAIRPTPDLLSAPFLFAYLSTRAVADYVTERVNTLMQPNLSIADLRAMPIPLPPRRDQQRIQSHITDLRTETQRLVTIYSRKLAALDELKKSLLHQAFTGQL